MIKVYTRHASYLSDALCPVQRKVRVEWVVEKVNEIRSSHKIHALVVRGVSGMAIGTIVSYLTDLPLMILRKGTDSCHSSANVEANFSIRNDETLNLVVIDDLISTGDTMHAICREVETEILRLNRENEAKLSFQFVGILLYAYSMKEKFRFRDGVSGLISPMCPVHGYKLI